MRFGRAHFVTSAVIAVFFIARFFTTVCILANLARPISTGGSKVNVRVRSPDHLASRPASAFLAWL